ncbi:MAG: EF-hand domain-containing protein [Roseovarius sp.]|uniref:EF-hand domain-containing protein n=1 Tax=Roseovarius sp. TaxID=1486281 RepID=UPI0032EBE081
MFKKLTSAGLIFAFVAPTAVLAEDASASMDADGDGAVTMSEFNEAMPDAGTEVFAEIDADADGTLSDEEISAATDAGVLPDTKSRG